MCMCMYVRVSFVSCRYAQSGLCATLLLFLCVHTHRTYAVYIIINNNTCIPALLLPTSFLPFQLLWNTGNWEFADTNAHWDDYWKYVLVQRHSNAMLQLKWQQSVKKFVWVTTSDMHPGAQNKFGQTEDTLRRHLQWWNKVGDSTEPSVYIVPLSLCLFLLDAGDDQASAGRWLRCYGLVEYYCEPPTDVYRPCAFWKPDS